LLPKPSVPVPTIPYVTGAKIVEHSGQGLLA
jgi:hypothetical protein